MTAAMDLRVWKCGPYMKRLNTESKCCHAACDPCSVPQLWGLGASLFLCQSETKPRAPLRVSATKKGANLHVALCRCSPGTLRERSSAHFFMKLWKVDTIFCF